MQTRSSPFHVFDDGWWMVAVVPTEATLKIEFCAEDKAKYSNHDFIHKRAEFLSM